MASLNVRRIDDDVYEHLKARAARHGISIEEEVHRIIRRAVAPPERLGQLAVECFGEANGFEVELTPRESHEPLNLGD